MSRFAFVLPWLVACGGAAAMAPAPAVESKPPTPDTSASAPSASSIAASPSVTPSASTSSSGSVPSNATTLDAHAMLGPFKKPAEACKALASAEKGKAFDCLPGANLGPPPPKSAIDRAMLLVLSAKGDKERSVAHLALHTAAGWFVDGDGLESFTDAAMMKRYKTEVMPAGEEFFTGGALFGASFGLRYDFAEITVVVATDPSSGKKSSPTFHSVRGSSLVCALGPSGAPSCIDPIRTAPQPGKNGAPPPEAKRVSLSIAGGVWTIDGAQGLSLLRNAGHFDTHEDVLLAGAYVLHFP